MADTALLKEAQSLYQSGRISESEAILQRLVTEPTLAGQALHGIAMIKLSAGDKTGAWTYFTRSLEAEPKNPHAFAHLGELAATSGETEKAMAFYRRALSLDPSHSAALAGLAKLAGPSEAAGQRNGFLAANGDIDEARAASDGSVGGAGNIQAGPVYDKSQVPKVGKVGKVTPRTSLMVGPLFLVQFIMHGKDEQGREVIVPVEMRGISLSGVIVEGHVVELRPRRYRVADGVVIAAEVWDRTSNTTVRSKAGLGGQKAELQAKWGPLVGGLAFYGAAVFAVVFSVWVLIFVGLVGSMMWHQIHPSSSRAVPAGVGDRAFFMEGNLEHQGIPYREVREHSNRYQPDLVIRTDPPPGTDVPAGGEVTVYVSSGPEPPPPTVSSGGFLQVPNVIGQQTGVGDGEIRKAGLRPRWEFVKGAGAWGTVVRTAPASGARVNEGDVVTLYIAS